MFQSRLLLSAKPITAVCLLLGAMSVSAQENGLITVVSPAPGQVVRPGEVVPVIVVVDPSISPARVAFLPDFSAQIMPLEWAGEPYEGLITIPDGAFGSIDYEVWADDGSNPDEFLSTHSGMLQVQVDDPPAKLYFFNTSFYYPWPLDPTAESKQIRPTGHYTDGTRRPLIGSASGSTFVSSNPAVASVDAEGIITPVGIGIAFITVQNSGLQDWVIVMVSPPGHGHIAPVEITPSVSVTASGFRWDPKTRTYAQNIYATNIGSMPLPGMDMVFFDLPEGVTLLDGGKTKNILPLGTPGLGLKHEPTVGDPGSFRFIRPGETAKATVHFRNRNKVPIVYNYKVYYGDL